MELKTSTKIIRIIIFVAITGVLFSIFFRIFYWKETEGISGFYKLENESCDLLFLGSSHNYCTVDPQILIDDYDIPSYNMGDSGQNIGTTYYYLEEALKTQKPKVVTVELLYLRASESGVDNGNLYRNTIGMNWSLTSVKNIRYALGLTDIEDKAEMFLDIFFKFPVFHSRYNELTEADFREDTDRPLGFKPCDIVESFTMPDAVNEETAGVLTEEQLSWMDRFIALSQEEGFELVFYIAPYIVNEEEMQAYNAMEIAAKERNIPFINFNKYDIVKEIDLDYSNDFRDYSHVNSYGAEKVTRYFGEYLKAR